MFQNKCSLSYSTGASNRNLEFFQSKYKENTDRCQSNNIFKTSLQERQKPRLQYFAGVHLDNDYSILHPSDHLFTSKIHANFPEIDLPCDWASFVSLANVVPVVPAQNMGECQSMKIR